MFAGNEDVLPFHYAVQRRSALASPWDYDRWVWEHGTGVRDADGDHVGLEGFLQDITQRKQAEQAMHEAERRFRSLFENAVEGIFQSMPDKGYLAVNPALAAMYGYASPQEMILHLRDIEHQLYVDPGRRTEFLLHYQPKVQLDSGKVVGGRSPDPLGESRTRTGVAGVVHFARGGKRPHHRHRRMGVRTACAQNVAWQRAGYPALPISVNLSPRQLVRDDIVDLVADVLKATALAPRYLELEITETVVMRDVDKSLVTLKKLKENGCDEVQGYHFGRPMPANAFVQAFLSIERET